MLNAIKYDLTGNYATVSSYSTYLRQHFILICIVETYTRIRIASFHECFLDVSFY